MRRLVASDLLRFCAVAVAFVAGPAMATGCGGGGADVSEGQIAPEDPAKVEARNKSMEEYMNSAEGKKAAKGPR